MRKHLPLVLCATGALAILAAYLGLANLIRFRTILVLGLSSADWLILLAFASLISVLTGLGVSGARLATTRPVLSFLCGVVVFAGALLVCGAGYLAWVFSGVHDRSEAVLADGRSIVVTQECWHHCRISISQRSGMYVDPMGASTVADWHVDVAETVTVEGDVLTLWVGSGDSLTVRLRR